MLDYIIVLISSILSFALSTTCDCQLKKDVGVQVGTPFVYALGRDFTVLYIPLFHREMQSINPLLRVYLYFTIIAILQHKNHLGNFNFKTKKYFKNLVGECLLVKKVLFL